MKKCKTLKNKIYAAVLMGCGLVPLFIDGDATALVFFGCVGVPLFFAKDEWVI